MDRAVRADDDLVRRDHAGDERFAQSPRCVDQHVVGLAGDRVGREGDERDIAADELLDDDGNPAFVGIQAALPPVGDGALGPERGPAALDRLFERVEVADVEDRVVQTGKGEDGRVLSGSR